MILYSKSCSNAVPSLRASWNISTHLIPCGNQLVPSMALVALVLLQRLPSLAGRQCPLHRGASPAAHQIIPFRRHQTPTVAVLHGPPAGTVELHPFVQLVHGIHGCTAEMELDDLSCLSHPSKTSNAEMLLQRSPK